MADQIVMKPEGIPDGKRRRTNASTKLLHEWLTLRYPETVPMYELRLGPTEKHLLNREVSPALEAMLRNSNWFADAVLLLPSEGLVIEAKVDPEPGAVGQVLFYLRLLWRTPELSGSMHLPLVPVVLFAEDDSEVSAFARQLGCRVEIYTPDWIETYLVERQFQRRLSTRGNSTSA